MTTFIRRNLKASDNYFGENQNFGSITTFSNFPKDHINSLNSPLFENGPLSNSFSQLPIWAWNDLYWSARRSTTYRAVNGVYADTPWSSEYSAAYDAWKKKWKDTSSYDQAYKAAITANAKLLAYDPAKLTD